jgi:hypothetical protein
MVVHMVLIAMRLFVSINQYEKCICHEAKIQISYLLYGENKFIPHHSLVEAD